MSCPRFSFTASEQIVTLIATGDARVNPVGETELAFGKLRAPADARRLRRYPGTGVKKLPTSNSVNTDWASGSPELFLFRFQEGLVV